MHVFSHLPEVSEKDRPRLYRDEKAEINKISDEHSLLLVIALMKG
jgi:hypothetical protein